MAEKLYLDEANLRAAGVSETNIFTLRALTAFVDTQNQLAEAQSSIDANADDIADLAANDVILAAADAALDARIDAYDALAPFVRQNQAARPSYTVYGGQTVSVIYTQAEAQQTDDKLKALSTAFDTLLSRLDTVNLLT